jgi:hypothetical protein
MAAFIVAELLRYELPVYFLERELAEALLRTDVPLDGSP